MPRNWGRASSKCIRRCKAPPTRLRQNFRTLLRKPLPAQAIAIGGLAKHLKTARAARIVAECGAGKTYMALGTGPRLKANTILVMCPSHIAKKWAREAIKTIPSVRTFLVEDMRNGGDPNQPHGVCEVRLAQGPCGL